MRADCPPSGDSPRAGETDEAAAYQNLRSGGTDETTPEAYTCTQERRYTFRRPLRDILVVIVVAAAAAGRAKRLTPTKPRELSGGRSTGELGAGTFGQAQLDTRQGSYPQRSRSALPEHYVHATWRPSVLSRRAHRTSARQQIPGISSSRGERNPQGESRGRKLMERSLIGPKGRITSRTCKLGT